jgi:hypothetical protein
MSGAAQRQSLPDDLPCPYRRKSGGTDIYKQIMAKAERRRRKLGLSMERLSEFAGLPDRYFAKALYCDSASGRQASWALLQAMVDVLFADGFDVRITPRQGPRQAALMDEFHRRFQRKQMNSAAGSIPEQLSP